MNKKTASKKVSKKAPAKTTKKISKTKRSGIKRSSSLKYKIAAVIGAFSAIFAYHHYYDLRPLLGASANFITEKITADPYVSGTLVRLSDGDSFTIKSEGENMPVRLYGIDAPELAQNYGMQAKQALSEYLEGALITLDIIDIDQYGRHLAVAKVGEDNINELMVKNGHAWVYKHCDKPFCKDWRAYEKAAVKSNIGLWRSEAVPPWDFRKKHQR